MEGRGRRGRLLVVVTLAEVGGAQAYVRDLLPAATEELDVTVAAHGEGPLRAAALACGVPFVPLRHLRRELSPLHDALALVELVGLCRRLRPDIVHLNSSKAGVLGRVAGAVARVPARVFTVHGWAFKAASGRAASAYLWADRAVRPLTTMVVCVSETERQAGLRARACSAGKTVVIRNAVDVDGMPVRAPQTRTSRPLEVVSVGRLAEPKDFETLVTALAGLPPGTARLTILGDGPLRGEIEDLLRRLGVADSVVLAGEVADVRQRLAVADVFVLSSRSEGLPISVLEAMAAGLPVVASDVGGLHEVVVDGATGYLVAPGDATALAGRVAELAADPDLRTMLGAAARRRAEERFSLPRWRLAHLELYRALLRDAGTRRRPS